MPPVLVNGFLIRLYGVHFREQSLLIHTIEAEPFWPHGRVHRFLFGRVNFILHPLRVSIFKFAIYLYR